MCIWELCLFISQLHVSGSISEECVCWGCVSLMSVCACGHMRTLHFCSCLSPPMSGNMSGMYNHMSSLSSLGHGVCSLIGSFPGVGPNLLAVLWSLGEKMGRLWDKVSPGLGSFPLSLMGTQHLEGSQHYQSTLFLS